MGIVVFQGPEDGLSGILCFVHQRQNFIGKLPVQLGGLTAQLQIFRGKGLPGGPGELHHGEQRGALSHAHEQFLIDGEARQEVVAPLAAADHIRANKGMADEGAGEGAGNQLIDAVAVPAVALVPQPLDGVFAAAQISILVFMEGIARAEFVPGDIQLMGRHGGGEAAVDDVGTVVSGGGAAVKLEAVHAVGLHQMLQLAIQEFGVAGIGQVQNGAVAVPPLNDGHVVLLVAHVQGFGHFRVRAHQRPEGTHEFYAVGAYIGHHP